MAETLISPGVLARENDQSQVTSQPVQAGACLVGPTVLGRVGIPKLVTSYSEYLSTFGSTFASGSDTYSYFTSISAYNYFNNGGTSLIIDRVASGSWSQANTTTDPIRNNVIGPDLNLAPYNFTGSTSISAQGGNSTSSPYIGLAVLKDGAATSTTFDVVRGVSLGKFTQTVGGGASGLDLKATINGGTAPTNLYSTTYNSVPLTVGSNTSANVNVVITNEIFTDAATTVTLNAAGSGYLPAETVTFAQGAFGAGMLKLSGTSVISSLTGASGIGLATANAAAAVSDFVYSDPTSIPAGDDATITANVSKVNGKLFAAAALALVSTGNLTGATINASQTIILGSGLTQLPINGTSTTTGTLGSLTFTTDNSGAITCAVSATSGTGYTDGTTIVLDVTALNTALGAALGTITESNGDATVAITLAEATDIASEIISITPASTPQRGRGYSAGQTITIASAIISGITGATVFTLTSTDVENSTAGSFSIANAAASTVQTTSNLLIETTSVTLNTQGASDEFAVNQVLTVASTLIGDPTSPPGSVANLTLTVTSADLIDDEAFTLETLTDGIIMNSGANPTVPNGTNGTLALGTPDNVRWEIQARDESTGTFSLIIRQGNDTQTAKRVLEIFPNVSLDPKSSNYIARIVGDMKKTLNGSGTADPYISTEGSYPNASRYVRVSNVKYKTPEYFDNNGAAKAVFKPYLPDVASGSFALAAGANITSGAGYEQELYYDKISDTNTQGIKDGVGNGLESYTDAFNVLANKDDYSYNIISAPGLYIASANWATPLNVMITNTATRGDAIAIVDLVSYAGGTVTTATTQAASLDNSYAAAYWPWVQILDPDTRQLVWTVPSSMIPGVYAYNDRTSEAWFAPAGINRGGLNTVVQAQRKLTQTNRDDLYTGKVNPIATFPGRGVVVFGQKTLQSQASALDRINVRRLLIALKSYIVQIADNLVFEQNTAATRNNFLSQVNPYLESVQQRQGLYAFKVVMDSSNNGPDVVDRNQMVGAIYIQPTKTAEFIYLDFNILPTGATFPS